jgi:hypothetical protein
MDISINTPALLFPAISLLMLAHTNRFLALTSVVRSLHDKSHTFTPDQKDVINRQIESLRFRIKLVKYMQAFGVAAILSSIISMYFIYSVHMDIAQVFFAMSLIFFAVSLVFSFWEILLSTKALELQLGDVGIQEDPVVFGFIKKKTDSD